MKRIIIYIVMIVVVVGGLLAVFWFFPELFPFIKSENINQENENLNQSNENMNINTNVDISNVNMNVNAETGSIDVDQQTTYKDITFKVLTANKVSEYRNNKAGNNNTLVVLYLDKMIEKDAPEILAWIREDVTMVGKNNTSYQILEANLAGKNSPVYATSYILFEAASNDSDFVLNFGSGDGLKTINLGF